MLSIRSKTIISTVAVILSISGAYFFFFIKQRDQSQELIIQAKKELVTTLVGSQTRELNNYYTTRVKTFVEHHGNTIKLFAERNKDELYRNTLPIYKVLHEENNNFAQISFILPDKTVFLRVHNNEKLGDEDLFPCRFYSEQGKELKPKNGGYLYGNGGLLYQVSEPLYNQGEFIGNVLFCISMESFINEIKVNLGIHTTFAVRKDRVDQTDREKFNGFISGEYFIFEHSDPFFRQNLNSIKLTGKRQSFVHQGIEHVLFPSFIVKDLEGNEIGSILQAVDLADIVTSYHDDIVRLLIITFSVIILASLILYFAFSNLIGEVIGLNRKLEQKNEELIQAGKELEEQVLKRTAELGDANVQLIKEIENRHEVNLSLILSIEEWQSTFDAIADPVTILDTNLEVVIANKAARELLSKDDKEIVGRTCHELFAGCSTPCETCPLSDVFATGVKKEYEVEHDYLGRNFLVSCSPIYDKKELTGFVHTAKDITEEKILKTQLSQAQKMEAIATLAGGIAHDFNNILGAILGNADLLLYRLVPSVKNADDKIQDISLEDIASHIEAIKKAGHRAKELVSQILAFSRQSKSQRQNVLITPVIKEGVKLLRSSLAANIEIKSSIEPEPCHINADLSQIHQVFMNLCTNAAQAMREKGGVLDISLKNFELGLSDRKIYPDVNPGRYLALAIKDTGHGISNDIMERIFDPFFTTRDVGEGTGMGLSVIHGIITSHQGVLDVKSEVSVGSEFTVFFPCIESDHENIEDPVLGVPRGKEKILFVDDELDIVKMSSSMLQYLGYTVVSATSGEKALEMINDEASDADLVICDYSMPGMSGVELAGELLNIRRDLPFILCSGFSESVILDDDTKKVIRKFMSKPLDMKKLAIAIREVLS